MFLHASTYLRFLSLYYRAVGPRYVRNVIGFIILTFSQIRFSHVKQQFNTQHIRFSVIRFITSFLCVNAYSQKREICVNQCVKIGEKSELQI